MLSKQLKEFFGDKWTGYEDEDFKTFLQYVKYSLDNDKALNQNFMIGYASVLPEFIEQLQRRKDLIEACGMTSFDWNKSKPKLSYQTHIAERGWSDDWKEDNQISNPLDQKLRVEAIKIGYPSAIHKLYYSVYYNDSEGWSEEILSPEIAGTTGKSKPIFGMRVRFDEAGAKAFDILYRMHKFDGEWTPWARNGETIYSHGQKLNAIQIKLEAKN